MLSKHGNILTAAASAIGLMPKNREPQVPRGALWAGSKVLTQGRQIDRQFTDQTECRIE
jgi:hypothetical protein